jgi:hypothetical protein
MILHKSYKEPHAFRDRERARERERDVNYSRRSWLLFPCQTIQYNEISNIHDTNQRQINIRNNYFHKKTVTSSEAN